MAAHPKTLLEIINGKLHIGNIQGQILFIVVPATGPAWWMLGNQQTQLWLRFGLLCVWGDSSWWRHQMETFSLLLALCAGNSPVTGEFP